eukprot:scaffold337_cov172-Amphora_coffeaeformis.AAC.7
MVDAGTTTTNKKICCFALDVPSVISENEVMVAMSVQSRKRRATITSRVQLIFLFVTSSIYARVSLADRAYPLGCSNEPKSYYDYHKNTFPPPGLTLKNVNDYLIVQRLGTGKFSDVFEAVDVDLEKDLKRQVSSSSSSKTMNTSSTLESTFVDPRTVVVLKCLKPVSERKLRREILILQHASLLPNLARIQALVLPTKNENGESIGVPTLVLQHAGPECRWLSHYGGGSTSLGTLQEKKRETKGQSGEEEEEDEDDEETTLSDYEIRYYLFHLLVALDGLHQKGIMHRDVKPRNILIRRLGHTGNRQQVFSSLYSSTSLLLGDKNPLLSQTQRTSSSMMRVSPLMLIDLGLADFYRPNQKYNVRVASRHYKSPELLVGYEYYDYALDLWGVGCILASLLCFREPFFRGKDNLDQLGKIIMQLGTADLLSYILKYNMQVDLEVQKLIQSYHASGHHLNRKPWIDVMAKDPGRRAPDAKGLDLLDKLLVYDHEKRWNARQAMEHPFFDVVRRRVLTEVRSFAGPNLSLPSLSNLPSSVPSQH